MEKEKLDELQATCVEELLAFFSGPKAVRESKTAKHGADLAVRTMSAVGRIRATERARDMTQLNVIQGMAKDQQEFKRYVAASMPHLNPAKQIT